jgi:hypothetical protein
MFIKLCPRSSPDTLHRFRFSLLPCYPGANIPLFPRAGGRPDYGDGVVGVQRVYGEAHRPAHGG